MNSLETKNTAHPHAQHDFDDAITLEMQVQDMNAVLDIMVTLGRVGAEVVSMRAESSRVCVTYRASEFVSRRLPSLLRTLVPVLDVTAIKGIARCEACFS